MSRVLRNRVSIGAIALTLVACSSAPSRTFVAETRGSDLPGEEATARANDRGEEKRFELRQQMRRLWGDYAAWTRELVVATTSNVGDVDAVARRIDKNMGDVGGAFTPFLGPDGGRRLGTLLKEHARATGDLLAAAKASDQAKMDDAERRARDGAAEIAAFLERSSASWSRHDLKSALDEHRKLLTNAAKLRLGGEFADDAANYDRAREQALVVADLLTDGVIRQFPGGFR
jgi:hypothetical protein